MDVVSKIGNWDSVNNNCLLLTTFSSCPISMPAGYLGSSPVLSGYKVTLQSSSSSPSSLSITKFTNPQLTRLSTTLEEEAEENYIAGLWHHDKTGRRWSWLWFWWSWQDMMIVMLHYKKKCFKGWRCLSTFTTLTARRDIPLRWPLFITWILFNE